MRAQVDEGARLLEPTFPAVAVMLGDAKADITAFANFPQSHWKKLWSTNPLAGVSDDQGWLTLFPLLGGCLGSDWRMT